MPLPEPVFAHGDFFLGHADLFAPMVGLSGGAGPDGVAPAEDAGDEAPALPVGSSEDLGHPEGGAATLGPHLAQFGLAELGEVLVGVAGRDGLGGGLLLLLLALLPLGLPGVHALPLLVDGSEGADPGGQELAEGAAVVPEFIEIIFSPKS